MRDHYAITIPVKPYIYKYVSATEGSPLQYTSRTLICTTLRRFLHKNAQINFQFNVPNLVSHDPVNFTRSIEIEIPARYRHEVLKELSDDVIIACNIFLQEHFNHAFLGFLSINMRSDNRYQGHKEIAMNFARLHNVIIEEDITSDALLQNCFRARKKNNNMQNSCPFPGSFLVAV